MGQKTNPNILQLSKTNDWNYKYIEKTSKDYYLQTHKILESKKFIYNFFKNNGLIIQTCKLNYSNNNLSILISYHQNYASINNINEVNKKQKIFIKKNFVNKKNAKKQFKILKSIKNYFNYQNVIYKNDSLKKKFKLKKKNLKIKRLKFIKYYKKYLILKKNTTIKNSFSNFFFKILFDSLFEFYKTLNSITLILKPLNNNLYKTIKTKKKFLKIKKRLVKLRKYQRNEFFKEGIGIAFSTISNKNSSELLAKYIVFYLQKLKKHNFFLRFLKTLLKIFVTKSFINIIKGIKIKVKGRLNGAPRAKTKTINVGKNMSLFTIDSSINYSEKTAYTANGTLGIKVWICEN